MGEFAGVLPPRSRLHEYELERVLGRPGGFGITYLATDAHLAKQVAIKEFLPTEFAVRGPDDSVTLRSEEDSEVFRWGMKSFLNEARVLARFKHPNVVEVYRYFEAHHTAYIVMEYVQGETLHELLKREGTLDEARISALLQPIAEGLRVLHDQGVVHRDIKPDNIMIRPDGQPVLIDFGAARNAFGSRSSMLSVLLTPGYAPIEQYSATGVQGPWSDIYALGAVAYRMIDGKRPCDSVERIDRDGLIPISRIGAGRYSPAMLAAVDRALSVHAKDRPQTIAEWCAEMFEGAAPPPRAQPVAPVSANEATTVLALPDAPRTVTEVLVAQAPLTATLVMMARETPSSPTVALTPPATPAATVQKAPVAPARFRWRYGVLAMAVVATLGLAAQHYGLRPAALLAWLDAPDVTMVPVAAAPAPDAVAARQAFATPAVVEAAESRVAEQAAAPAKREAASASAAAPAKPDAAGAVPATAVEKGQAAEFAAVERNDAAPAAAETALSKAAVASAGPATVPAPGPTAGREPAPAAMPAATAPTAAPAATAAPTPAAAPVEVAAISPQRTLPEIASEALAAESVEPAEFAGMLAAHNRWRQRYGVAPLRWSGAGAQDAQRWAEQLSTEGCALRFNPDPARRKVFRENLMHVFATKPYDGWRRTPEQVVERWGKAEPIYDAEARRCRSPIDGCTQFAKVVDGGLHAVGCGRARCEAGEVWVCSYSPTA